MTYPNVVISLPADFWAYIAVRGEIPDSVRVLIERHLRELKFDDLIKQTREERIAELKENIRRTMSSNQMVQ